MYFLWQILGCFLCYFWLLWNKRFILQTLLILKKIPWSECKINFLFVSIFFALISYIYIYIKVKLQWRYNYVKICGALDKIYIYICTLCICIVYRWLYSEFIFTFVKYTCSTCDQRWSIDYMSGILHVLLKYFMD
jgi:hypothetical protein